MFRLRPRLDDAHLVTVEKQSFEPGLPSNEFRDSHGNLAGRSMLKPGRNDIRYDALVAVSSTPENQGAPGVLPVRRPSVTGFTTTSNIATAQGGGISPHQRKLNNATGVCRDFAHVVVALCRTFN